jgi:hypothetical protein
MKYLLMCYTEEKKLAALSKSECDALMDETQAYIEALRKNGTTLPPSVSNPLKRPQWYGFAMASCPRPMAPSPRRRSSLAASGPSTPGI